MLKVVALLINYNGYGDTIECVESLLNQTYPLYKIIVVDNASANGDSRKLKKKFGGSDRVVILDSGGNLGFAGGNNFGIKYALERFDVDFFLILNNDTVASPNLVDVFVETYRKLASSGSKVGIITGRIYYYKKRDVVWFAGGKICGFRCAGYHRGMNVRGDFLSEDGIPKEVSFATGCLWFVPASVFKEVGLLPEEYFLYIEDVDYCMKLLKRGYKIFYQPKAVVWHKVGSAGCFCNQPDYYWPNRNRIIFCAKHFGLLRLFPFLFFFLLPTRVVRFFEHALFQKKFVNTFSGITDGLRYVFSSEFRSNGRSV